MTRHYEKHQASFATFLADVGSRPSSRYSLDRINNDGDYEPGNVRWATPAMQIRNSRKAKLSLEQATLIRTMHRDGWTYRKLAAHFNVAKGAIQKILLDVTWKE